VGVFDAYIFYIMCLTSRLEYEIFSRISQRDSKTSEGKWKLLKNCTLSSCKWRFAELWMPVIIKFCTTFATIQRNASRKLCVCLVTDYPITRFNYCSCVTWKISAKCFAPHNSLSKCECAGYSFWCLKVGDLFLFSCRIMSNV